MATSRSNPSDNRTQKKKASTWRSVRMPQHASVAHTLQQRYSLRWHGLLIGSFTLLLMWCTSHVQMLLGVESLALRYFITLSVGYLGYLLVLRAWAARLVRQPEPHSDGDAGDVAEDVVDGALDLADASWSSGRGGSGTSSSSSSSGGGNAPLPRTGGSNLGGGGGSSSSSDSGVLGDLASGAADALGSADEGAVVVVPVVAIFLIGTAVILGAGSLAMLFFGWDVLLTVAVELAFSVATARAAVGVEREGWLSAAVRLTWKPLLGALVCAVVLGATIDHFLPDVNSLPQALRVIQGR